MTMKPPGCCRQSWPCSACLCAGVFACANVSVRAYKEGNGAHVRQFMALHSQGRDSSDCDTHTGMGSVGAFYFTASFSGDDKIRSKILIRVVAATVKPVEVVLL